LPDAKKASAPKDHRHLTTVLLTDGLAGTGERLVNALYEGRLQSGARVVGGAAGDEGAFKQTQVGATREATPDAAAALHVFSAVPWGVGIDHGLRPTSKPMRVTKAHDNVVAELDGQPAFLAYKKHAAGRGVQLTPDSAGAYMIANELGVHFFEKVTRARAPLGVSADGSLTCAGDIPKGAMVSILDGDPANMIEAARTAAKRARAELNGRRAAGVLLFDCVCRGMILKEQFNREVAVVREEFPGAPIAGFLTYGEIARTHEILEGWHNTTAVVVAIPE
jgi:methyl-accepting chemotaxis protein